MSGLPPAEDPVTMPTSAESSDFLLQTEHTAGARIEASNSSLPAEVLVKHAASTDVYTAVCAVQRQDLACTCLTYHEQEMSCSCACSCT